LMEFNIQNMHSGKVKVRAVINGNYYDPCNKLPGEYRKDCYFALPLWWTQVVPESIEKHGELCFNPPDGQYKKDCFLGIGRAQTFIQDGNQNIIADGCKHMPNMEGKQACIEESARSLMILGAKNPVEFCELFSEVYLQGKCKDAINEFNCEIHKQCS
jgi:hypothetical protein